MSYVELIKTDVYDAGSMKFLSEGKQMVISIRMPRNLRDSGKETTVVRDANFSTLVGRGLIQQFVEKG